LNEISETTFTADIYLRLSKQDGDNEESDSIGNQRALILDFLKTQPDIRLHKIKIDDGRSGVDFCRPAFSEMIDDIKAGTVNCVIVKDAYVKYRLKDFDIFFKRRYHMNMVAQASARIIHHQNILCRNFIDFYCLRNTTVKNNPQWKKMGRFVKLKLKFLDKYFMNAL
jgi:hypothetical protein